MAGLGSHLGGRVFWEARRLATAFLRKAGWVGVAAVALCLLATGGALLVRQTAVKRAASQVQLERIDQAKEKQPVISSSADDLAAFYAYLPAHDDIPETVKRLLILAEDEKVSLASGEYQAKAENGYMAYRMSFPVKGDAAAVQSFIIAALRQHPTLAIETATFRREKIEAGEAEARVHFTLLTRLPDPSARPRTP